MCKVYINLNGCMYVMDGWMCGWIAVWMVEWMYCMDEWVDEKKKERENSKVLRVRVQSR